MSEIKEIWYVTLFLEDMAYGGCEEGGWWFDVGHPVESEEDEAREYYESVYEKTREMNEGKHGKYSVLSDGEYHFHVDNEEPKSYPEFRPHYE